MFLVKQREELCVGVRVLAKHANIEKVENLEKI
jgi:hypothetical protein